MQRAMLAVVAGFFVGAAFAQVPDHLTCFKIKDPTPKARYTADLGWPSELGSAVGCRISTPAQLYCAPTVKTNVQPPPPGGGATDQPGAFVCYKAKCPTAALQAAQVTDQFGARPVQPTRTRTLCAPVAPSTTTSSTTTSTTTTTVPLPACGSSEFPTCNGGCPDGDPPCAPLDVPDFTGCRCPPVQCGTYPACNGPCPDGKVCVGFALPGFAECGCYPPPP
jgi:hypothetical protein